MSGTEIKIRMNNISLNNLLQALGLSLIAAGVVTVLNAFWSGLLAIILGLYLVSRTNKQVQNVAINFLEKVKAKYPERVNLIGQLEWFYIKIMKWNSFEMQKEPEDQTIDGSNQTETHP